MVDNSWDNSQSGPVGRRGMPLWGKVAVGCGVTFLLLLATCVGGIAFAIHKGTGTLDQVWTRVHAEVIAVSTAEGARKLYRENPGLADRYPTEEAFLSAVEGWRGKLDAFPSQRPEFSQMLRHKKDFSFRTQFENGHKVQALRIRLENGTLVQMEFENERLVDLSVE